jgi:hypothetical protein
LDVPNRYGELPFLDKNLSRPNPRYFELLDWVVDRAAHYGLRLAITPINAGRDVIGVPQAFDADNARSYSRWLASRYKGKGIFWVLGGDVNPLWPKDGSQSGALVDYTPIFDAMADGLLEGNGGPVFITYHPTGGHFPSAPAARTSLYLGHRAWLTMNALQSGHWLNPEMVARVVPGIEVWNAGFVYEPIYQEYLAKPTRPIVDLEAAWEDIAINLDYLYQKGSQGYFRAYDCRNDAYHAVFAGAAGHSYGNDNVTYFYDPKHHPAVESQRTVWWEALQAVGSRQVGFVRSLMLSRPYFSRIPDQSLIVGSEGQGRDHIAATRDRHGSYAFIYLPRGQPVTVDLTKVSGKRAIAWWFDPRSGQATRIHGTFPTTEAHVFSPPTNGADSDWVLVVDDAQQKLRHPGAAR